ncbi:hypothetical protein MKD33_08685, partial [Chromobacterium piscinae]
RSDNRRLTATRLLLRLVLLFSLVAHALFPRRLLADFLRLARLAALALAAAIAALALLLVALFAFA